MSALALKAGMTLGHFTIESSLGVGGMAEVYKAHDSKLNREVALKILPPDVARDETLFSRFKSEVRQIAQLNHRNIVTLYEYGREGNLLYYSMQLLPNGDLAKRLREGALPEREAYRILCRMLDALACAQQLNIVHRDIKPENILFSEENEPVLTDFGIAKIITEGGGITKTGMTVGTPSYISPEQARGKPVDARTDLYALGVVFYEMLVGKPPFRGTDAMATIMKHLSEPPPPLPDPLKRYQPIISRLLAKNPDERPQSAAQLIRALQKQRKAERAASTNAEQKPATAAVPAPPSARAPTKADVPKGPPAIDKVMGQAPAQQPQQAAAKASAPEKLPKGRFVITRLHILLGLIAVAVAVTLFVTL